MANTHHAMFVPAAEQAVQLLRKEVEEAPSRPQLNPRMTVDVRQQLPAARKAAAVLQGLAQALQHDVGVGFFDVPSLVLNSHRSIASCWATTMAHAVAYLQARRWRAKELPKLEVDGHNIWLQVFTDVA
jgi:hypothetical protein